MKVAFTTVFVCLYSLLVTLQAENVRSTKSTIGNAANSTSHATVIPLTLPLLPTPNTNFQAPSDDESAESTPKNAANSALSVTINDLTTSTKTESVFATPAPQILPADHSDFESMKSRGMVYVDKTAFIKKIQEAAGAEEDPFIFITRPTRFGKTTFIEMLKHYYFGNKTLFKGTYIAEQMPGNWTKYPVIHLNFGFVNRIQDIDDVKEFESILEDELYRIGKCYGLDCRPNCNIRHLIGDLREKCGQKVVILIDEYDQVFEQHVSTDENTYTNLKTTVVAFYNAIKSQTDNLRLLFITGVSRMSLSRISGGLNNMQDITFDENFSTVMGFTLAEIISNFQPSLQKLATANKVDIATVTERLTQWYDGYRFSLEDETRIFNPISVITCLRELNFDNYWVRTGNIYWPTQRMISSGQNFETYMNYKINFDDLMNLYGDEFDRSVPLAVLLHNYGYLTIKSYDRNLETVYLHYPNKEIRDAVREKIETLDYEPLHNPTLVTLFRQKDMQSFIDYLNDATFPPPNFCGFQPPTTEFGATNLVIKTLKKAGLQAVQGAAIIKGNDGKDKGDLDITCKVPYDDILLIVEVKFKRNAVVAILQLMEYAIKDPFEFRREINRYLKKDIPANAWLLGININQKQGQCPKIEDWILLPYRDGVIPMDGVQSNLPNVWHTLHIHSNEIWNKTANKVLIWYSVEIPVTLRPERQFLQEVGIEEKRLNLENQLELNDLVEKLKSDQYVMLHFTHYSQVEITKKNIIEFLKPYLSENLVPIDEDDIYIFCVAQEDDTKWAKRVILVLFEGSKEIINCLNFLITEIKVQREKKSLSTKLPNVPISTLLSVQQKKQLLNIKKNKPLPIIKLHIPAAIKNRLDSTSQLR